MPVQRRTRHVIYVDMVKDDKDRLYDIVEHIPYERVATFVRRAIQREMDLYEQDKDAYIQAYGDKD